MRLVIAAAAKKWAEQKPKWCQPDAWHVATCILRGEGPEDTR
jgi:hypothetical protein